MKKDEFCFVLALLFNYFLIIKLYRLYLLFDDFFVLILNLYIVRKFVCVVIFNNVNTMPDTTKEIILNHFNFLIKSLKK